MHFGLTAEDFGHTFCEAFVEHWRGFLGDDNSTGKDSNTSLEKQLSYGELLYTGNETDIL